MGQKEEYCEVALSDEHAGIFFSILGYKPNGRCTFGAIENHDALEGSFSYHLYDTGECGFGDFSICTKSVHALVRQLKEFLHSQQKEIQIKEELVIHLIKCHGTLLLDFSIDDQLGEYITVKKQLSYHELYLTILKPLDTISKRYP